MLTHQQLYELCYEGQHALFKYIENLHLHIENQEQLIGHRQQMTINDLSGRLAKVNLQLKRVKSKLATQECLVYELTRRLQQAQKALDELQQKQQASQGDVSRVGKDSHNSNLPPSSDPLVAKAANSLRRTRSLRRRSGRKIGGQFGHPGTTLLMAQHPDSFVVHKPEACMRCGSPLAESSVVGSHKRQVFDLPEVKVEVVEHRAETRRCSKCGAKTKAKFPLGIRAPVQYGQNLRARAIYLQKYQLLPYRRTSEVMRDLFGSTISHSAIYNAQQVCSGKLINSETRIKAELQRASVLGVDETGIRVAGKSHWVHIARTDSYTHYGYDSRRGKAAMDAIGILPQFKGTLVRDGWYSYDQYLQCQHSLCNAHVLRELIYVGEANEQQRKWSERMIKLLLEVKSEMEEPKVGGEARMSAQRQKKYVGRYERLIRYAKQINAPPSKNRTEEARRLINRLEQKREEVLRFMSSKEVPFDNNGSERDLRMVKLQQKTSGCFRSPEGADTFCRVRSYISTARKQGHSLLIALERVFRGKPLIFYPSKT